MCEEVHDPIKVKVYDGDVTYLDLGIRALSALQVLSSNYIELLIGDYLVTISVVKVLHHE